MRIWEFEDNKAIASDLVREQDFILRVRRLHRLGTAHLVLNLALSEIDFKTRGEPAEILGQRLTELAKASQGVSAEMANGDLFLVWPESPASAAARDAALRLLMEGQTGGSGPDPDAAPPCAIHQYRLPSDYTALRERTNYYVEVAQAANAMAEGQAPARMLQGEAATGALTAWNTSQVERLLGELELRRYVRAQPVYEHDKGAWRPLFTEYFVSFDELKRDFFPKLDIAAPEHLFFELCQAIDRNLLAELAERFDAIAGERIHLNLSVASVLGAAFAQFVRHVPKEARHLIGFELHRGDLLQDFTRTLNAFHTLRQEGFGIAIDAVTPDMLPYVNLERLNPDYIKINIAKDRPGQLQDPAIRSAFAGLPREKIIFFRCDSEAALQAGLDNGVTRFQGWLIDDKAKGR